MRTFNPPKFLRISTIASLSLAGLCIFSASVIAQRACVMTDAGKAVCGKLLPDNDGKAQATSDKQQILESDEYRFELQSCRRNGQSVRCNLIITNLASVDRKFRLSSSRKPPSRLITTAGDQIMAQQVQLGQSQSPFQLTVLLIKGIPLKASLDFDGIPAQAKSLAVLEIGYSSYSSESTSIYRTSQFHNVSIH